MPQTVSAASRNYQPWALRDLEECSSQFGWPFLSSTLLPPLTRLCDVDSKGHPNDEEDLAFHTKTCHSQRHSETLLDHASQNSHNAEGRVRVERHKNATGHEEPKPFS